MKSLGHIAGAIAGAIATTWATPRGAHVPVPRADRPLRVAAPPRVRIVASSVPGTPGTVLTCHAWGFYPPAVTVEWLRDGAVVATGAAAAVLPRGDWTYQTQVPLRVPPRAGGTFTCAVRHASLGRPLRRRWGERGARLGPRCPDAWVPGGSARSLCSCRSRLVPGADGEGGGGGGDNDIGAAHLRRWHLLLLPPGAGGG